MRRNWSSGPRRRVPMRWEEASTTFDTARFPDRGKPLPGKEVRLLEHGGDAFQVTYHDTPVVTIYRDGTYLLDHGGYAGNMTIQRMEEYAPVRIEKIGKTRYHTKSWSEEPWLGADNLKLVFHCSITTLDEQHNLMYQFFPERFSRYCQMPFPRETLHVDANGLPVIDSLLEQLAPPEWKYRLQGRLQPWEQVPTLPGQAPVAHGPHAAEYRARWEPGTGPVQTATPVMLRREWIGNRTVASIWRENRQAGAPQRFRWVIPSSGLSGYNTRIELAIQRVDKELRRAGWISAPPLLTDVLGNLRSRLGGRAPDPAQPLLPFGQPLLLQRPVLKAHWMEPWSTLELAGSWYYWSSERRPMGRAPLPGALPWPGPEDVRVWFEFVDGTAVGIVHDAGTGRDEVLLRQLGRGEQTDWLVPGVLVAGLLGLFTGVL